MRPLIGFGYLFRFALTQTTSYLLLHRELVYHSNAQRFAFAEHGARADGVPRSERKKAEA